MDEILPKIDPARAALLVMDFQPAILSRLPDADALVARVAGVIAAARAQGVTVGYVRVAFEDSDYAAIPETNKSFSPLLKMPGFLQSDTPEAGIDSRVAPQDGDIVVRKVRVGAFSTTNLETQLRERDIDTLILAGISTSGVVLSTVRDAADRDYRIFVLSDACADPEAEVHQGLMEKVFPRQTFVTTSASFSGLLVSE